jgi:hypothetical protein
MIENNEEDEFAGIPDMPSDESIRDSLLKTGGVEHWDPFGSGQREPVDFSKMPKAAAEKIAEARLAAGPGPRGTPWQHAVHQQWKRKAELEREHERILSGLEDVRGYDPETGKGIPLISSPERRKAMMYRLQTIAEDMDRLEGEAGQRSLEREMAKAIKAAKVRHKQAYIQAEAKRRAQADATEEAIKRAADGYRKTLSNT